jgi:hypothetical protein
MFILYDNNNDIDTRDLPSRAKTPGPRNQQSSSSSCRPMIIDGPHTSNEANTPHFEERADVVAIQNLETIADILQLYMFHGLLDAYKCTEPKTCFPSLYFLLYSVLVNSHHFQISFGVQFKFYIPLFKLKLPGLAHQRPEAMLQTLFGK